MIYIIGAGLAGLTAGYELTKAGKQVTILETNTYPGGRVRSLPITGHMVDFGGFIVYPWYTEYHRLTKELGIHTHFTHIPNLPVYYELSPGNFVHEEAVSTSCIEKLLIYAAVAKKMLFHNSTIDSPNLSLFGDDSIATFIRKALKKTSPSTYERFTDIVSQGYCYGPATENRMSIVAPIAINTMFRGDLHKSISFSGENAKFPYALATYITSHGGKIHYNETVLEISHSSITTDRQTYTADSIIYAGRYDQPCIQNTLALETPATYTHFYNVVARVTNEPKLSTATEWGALFCLPDESQEYQVLSAVNIHALTHARVSNTYINLNVIARNNNTHQLTPEELIPHIQPDIQKIFDRISIEEITALVHWPGAMPVSSTTLIQTIRNKQGENNIWFAGDILGAPSMETAVRTGITAAVEVLKNSTP